MVSVIPKHRHSFPTGPAFPSATFGWTQFTPTSNDFRGVYVSDSVGLDADPSQGGYDGMYPDPIGNGHGPKKTIPVGKALLRQNHGDWLLLRRGDTFAAQGFGNWNLSGESLAFPMLIGAYSAGARPAVRPGAQYGIDFQYQTTVSNVAVVGIDLQLDTTENGGFSAIHSYAQQINLLVEDCFLANSNNGDGIYTKVSAFTYT